MDIKELIAKAEKFIKDNKLDFSGRGSELNGNCVILAGFICYLIENSFEGYSSDGEEIIEKLELSIDASSEMHRVFEYAFNSNYGSYWYSSSAKEQYIF